MLTSIVQVFLHVLFFYKILKESSVVMLIGVGLNIKKQQQQQQE